MSSNRVLSIGGEMKDMDTRTKALALLSVVLIAAIAGSFFYVTQLTKADPTTSVAADQQTTPSATSSVNITDNGPNGFGIGHMMGDQPRLGMDQRGSERGCQGFDGAGAIQVSSDFTANVTNIAKNDSDVQNLLSQGYNITSIRPVISTTIDGNGNVVTKASTADLTLIGTNARAFVVVDLTQAKVTKIVNFTVTEIDK